MNFIRNYNLSKVFCLISRVQSLQQCSLFALDTFKETSLKISIISEEYGL